MAIIRIQTNSAAVKRRLRAVARAMTPHEQDKVLRRVAWAWHSRMTIRTPKRWTGQTRRAWQVSPHSVGRATGFRLHNDSKVMYWLEHGTQAHGPKRAKRLFIPLTRRAAEAGARQVVAALQEARASAAQGQTVRPRFVPGRDFVFAKWVKGIRAMRIVAQARGFMQATTRAAMRQFIQEVTRHP